MSWSAETQETDTSVDADLKTIYQGGENFLARAQMLSNMRAASEQALKDLQLGQAAVTAFKQAKKDEADAKKYRDDAAAVLTEAEKRAQGIIADANTAAATELDKARQMAGGIVSSAEEARAEAERYVAEQKRIAAGQLEAANAKMAEALAVKDDAAKELDRAYAAAEESRAAKRRHDDLAAKLQAKLDRVAKAMNEDGA